jgi:hypothetical protein
MDFRQLLGNGLDQQRSAIKADRTNLQTAMPGIITAFDSVKMTCSIQPVIQGLKFNDGGSTPIDLPLLVDCPIIFPQGTNCVITFPITIGQECLVIFGSRCIDSWWSLGSFPNGKVTTRPPMESRMHDLSDGFCIPGPFSQPSVVPNISTTNIEIRTKDDLAKIGINVTTHVITINTTAPINITSGGTIDIIAPNTVIQGDMTCTGTITALTDMVVAAKHLKAHTHSDPQGGTTGPNN